MSAIPVVAPLHSAPLRRDRYTLARYTLLAQWLIVPAAFAAYGFADRDNQYLGALAGILIFAGVLYFLPECRPVSGAPLCPWNWALILFSLQLIVLPFSILALGPSIGVLPDLPSHFAIDSAMFLNAAGFLVFALTYRRLLRKSSAIKTRAQQSSSSANIIPSRTFIHAAIALGIFGLSLSFHNIAGLVAYYENPGETVDRLTAASHTLAGLLGLLLRPFLGFAFVVLWCRWLDRPATARSPRRAALVTIAAMSAVLLAYSTFGYNRGAFVVPLLAMTATLLRAKCARIGVILSTGLVLAIVFAIAPFWAVFRASNLTASELVDDVITANSVTDKIDLLETIQMYGSGPQYLGFLLEKSHWASQPYLGSTLFPSIVEPLPLIGRPFHDQSGPVIYNKMIYGTPEIFDQILPMSSELFLNFGYAGWFAGMALLALLAFHLQRAVQNATGSLDTYVWQYIAIWLLFLIMGSISIATQILFYSFCPVYAYLIWRRTQRNRLLRKFSLRSSPAHVA